MNIKIFALLLLVFIPIVLILFRVYRRYPLHLIYKSKLGLQSMIDAVGDPLAVISNDYTVMRVNKAYAHMLKHSFNECIGQKCHTLLRNSTTVCEDCRLKETLGTQKSQFVQQSVHPEGTGAVSISFSPYNETDFDSQACIIEHIRDISTLEKLKIDLEKKNHSLANAMKKLRKAQESIHDELRLARQIQHGLLPASLPESPRLKLDAAYKPISEVGGDIYDFLPISGEKLGLFIGDASGHGLSSALVGTISKMSLDFHHKSSITTSELLERMNSDLCRSIHTCHYLTCFWCIFDFQTDTVFYSRAGHPMPLVLRKDGSIEKLACSGPFLGILENAAFDSASFNFKPGDRFYFFTDGVYDVLQKDNKLRNVFGYDRFASLLSETASVPFENVIDSINNKLSIYSREDDYTLVIAEISY